MRILWVVNTFRYSAIELTVKSFIKNKKIRKNHQLYILQIDDKKNKPASNYINQLKKDGVVFKKINFKTFFGIPRLSVLIKTFNLLKSIKPEITHIYCERYSFFLCYCSVLLNIPTIRTVCHIFDLGDGIIPKIRRISKIIQRFILRKLNVKFLTCSKTNSIHESTYYFNNNATPIFNWFDPDNYSFDLKKNLAIKLKTDSVKQINLSSVGGNWDYKNFDSIINAIKFIKDTRPDIYNLINYKQIGSNNEKLKALAKKLQVSERCTFFGSVEDWRIHLYDSDFLIAPSTEEGLNLSVIEASAFGIIPVLSRRKCLNEHKRLGNDVIWLSDIDPLSISEKIIELEKYSIKDIKLKQQRIAKKSFEHYSSDKLIPKLLKVYEIAIKKGIKDR